MHILIVPSELFLTELNPFGGIFQYGQAKAFAKAGHQVGVISVGFITLRYLFKKYPYHAAENQDSLNILRKYERSFLLERHIKPEMNVQRYLKLFKKQYEEYICEFGHPDIVHAHNFFYAGFMAGWIKDSYGVPFVLTEHSSAFARGFVPNRINYLLSRVGLKAGIVSCVSSPFKRLMETRLDLHFEVLPNIVDSAFLTKKHINNSTKFVFLTLGSLEDNKNQALLLHAFSSRFKNEEVSLKIGGVGPDLLKLKNLARDLGISHQVFFLGHLSRVDVVQEMRRANCFVLSSNYETFGVVLIEALASGLPLIATRCGGPEDIVNAGNGILVDVGSVEQLASSMRYVKNNITKYNRDTLFNEANSLYSARAFVKKAIDFYERAIEKNSNY